MDKTKTTNSPNENSGGVTRFADIPYMFSLLYTILFPDLFYLLNNCDLRKEKKKQKNKTDRIDPQC